MVDSPVPVTAGRTVDIQVVTPDGTSAAVAADRFTYEGTPTVTGLSQVIGSLGGNNQITITGTNLDGEIDFGLGNAAPFIVSDTATQIVVTTPPGLGAGPVDVQVITAAGTSAVNQPADQFTYTSTPTITGLSPSAGTPNGFTSVIIHGANLDDAFAVSFGGVPVQPSDFFPDGLGNLVVTTPPGALGATVDVQVATPEGVTAITSADKYTYANVPEVYGLSPSAGPIGGGTRVTINGDNFVGATLVASALHLVPFQVASANQIVATSRPARWASRRSSR